MVSISVRRSLIASGGTSGAPDGVEAMSRGSNGVMPRPFEKLRDMPVRIPQVQPAATSADTRVNCHRPPAPHATPRPRRGREILEKLDPRAYIRTWLADDGLQISAGLLLLEQRAHAHRIPPG